MDELEIFYNQRKKEIDQYFLFLKELDIDQNNNYTISALGDIVQEDKIFELKEIHTQILKSSCILIIYNCIEGTVYKSLECIFDKISEEKLNYKSIIVEIQNIWFKSKIPQKNTIDEIKIEILFEHIEHIISNNINLNLKDFLEKNRGYFGKGNITDNLIHEELFPKIGLIVSQKIVEPKIDDIKENRNKLAHGGASFSELGKTLSFLELEADKNRIFKFLEKYVNEIKNYITTNKYKKN